MPTLPSFPTLIKRLIKGSPLTFAEGDGNEDSIRSYCLALAQFITGSFNADGTLIAGSVGSQALQAASVTLAALNPSLLYAIVPVDTDIGTVQNSYVITAHGGLPSANIVPGGAVYDSNGNYVLTGLTLNYGYFWTKNANDASVQSTPPLSTSGAFTANSISVVLIGTPNAPVQASVIRSAPISSYQDNQMFFVYTTTANSGPSTLNVNSLGAIPIKFNGQQLTASQIGALSVFQVVYKGGVFILAAGASTATSGGTGSTTVITTTGQSGTQVFNIPQQAIATSAFPVATVIAHGLGGVPSTFAPSLVCITADSGFAVGQSVSLSQFVLSGGGPAFDWSFDGFNLYFTQFGAVYVVNPTTGGAAGAITPASWQIQAQATIQTSYAGVTVFPALNYEVINPEGAFSYAQNLFLFGQSIYSNSNKYYINQINLLNNEVTPLAQIASSNNLSNVNVAVFGTSFQFAQPTAVMCTSHGIFSMPATNPGTNIIPPDTTYDNTGAASVTMSNTTAYIWTPGPNDTQLVDGANTYLASSAVNGQIAFTSTTTTAALTGAPGTIITGTLITAASTWSVSLFSTQGAHNGWEKPVWLTYSSGITAVWTVTSDYNSTGNNVSHIDCYKVTSAASQKNGVWATNNSAQLDLTNSSVANVSAFNAWHPAGSTARVLMFQYNPISKRIYVIAGETGFIHVFKITASSNDFSAWWNTASPTREQQLTYVKSLALAGTGRTATNLGQCHYSVEYDQNSGAEKCIVFTRDGNNAAQTGSVSRVPWVE